MAKFQQYSLNIFRSRISSLVFDTSILAIISYVTWVNTLLPLIEQSSSGPPLRIPIRKWWILAIDCPTIAGGFCSKCYPRAQPGAASAEGLFRLRFDFLFRPSWLVYLAVLPLLCASVSSVLGSCLVLCLLCLLLPLSPYNCIYIAASVPFAFPFLSYLVSSSIHTASSILCALVQSIGNLYLLVFASSLVTSCGYHCRSYLVS